MGGKRELELETTKCLLYCLHLKLTYSRLPSQQQKDYYFLTFIIIVKVISCHIMRVSNVSHVLLFPLSRKWRLFTYTFFLTLSYCFHPILLCILFPLQLPCLLQQSLTQICMCTFGCFFRLYRCLRQPLRTPITSFSSINGLVESHMNT